LRGKQTPAILVDAFGIELYRRAQYAPLDIVVNPIRTQPLKCTQSYTFAYSLVMVEALIQSALVVAEFLIELLRA
jgi:hypothetical protein